MNGFQRVADALEALKQDAKRLTARCNVAVSRRDSANLHRPEWWNGIGEEGHIKYHLGEHVGPDDRYLRTAIKHKGTIHMGDQGQAHDELWKHRAKVKPEDLDTTSETNTSTRNGFVNHKGPFFGLY